MGSKMSSPKTSDRRENRKVVGGQDGDERELQRTGREGKRWEKKTTPSRAETRRGEGKAPPGVGWGQTG